MPDERIVHVPYIRIDVDQKADTEARIVAAMNAQLELDGSKIPFVLPRDLAGKMMSCKKVVLYGASGCGKTRCLFEMLRSELPRRIYIINPKGIPEDAISRAHLVGILEECSNEDDNAIVWDNFPEGLEQQSTEGVKLAIKMLGSFGKRVYVTLSPRQFGKDGLGTVTFPGLKVLCLKHRPADINKFLSSFGSQIPCIRQVFLGSVKPALGEISSILWKLEPTPHVVLDYLREVYVERCDTPEDALALAKSLFRRSSYYEHQFAALKSMKKRKKDLEFLYTLKLCYELGVDRKLESIVRLQRRIFGTKPNPKVLSEFQLGLYRNGDQISIHDMAKDSILVEEKITRKMISFIADNYHWCVPCKDNNAYLLGTFVGRNSSLARKSDLIDLLPDRKMKDLRGNRFYQIGLGHGIGRIIDGLDAPMRKCIFESARTNNQFSKNLGEGIGWEMADDNNNNNNNHSNAIYRIIFNYAKGNLIFSRGLGVGAGMTLPRLSSKVKKDVFVQAERNAQFADGLGIGAGSIIEFMPPEEHLWLFRTAEYNAEFARGLGTGLGHNFVALTENIQSYSLALLSQNPQFARGFGMGLGDIFEYLQDGLQKTAGEIAGKNFEFAVGLGIGAGYSFSYFSSRLQQKTMQMSAQNPAFAYGAGLGIGFTYYYLSQQMRDMMLGKASSDAGFAVGLGDGYGMSYSILPAHLQKQVLSTVAANSDISFGFGMGVGYGYDYLSDAEKKAFAGLAQENKKFAEGLGYGLGRTFVFHDESLGKAILSKMVLNKEFAAGIGRGLGTGFFYLTGELQEKFVRMAGLDAEFARGLGTGLGAVFGYFSDELQEKVAEYATGNASLKEGIKGGFVQVWQYLDDGHRKFASDFCR